MVAAIQCTNVLEDCSVEALGQVVAGGEGIGDGGGRASGSEVPPPSQGPLSMGHSLGKGATLTMAMGGKVVKVHRPGTGPGEVHRVPRGRIGEFSPRSRRRLMELVMCVDRGALDASGVWFVTLTYRTVAGEWVPDPEAAKGHLSTFLDRLEYWYPESGQIWKLEPQKSGTPHFHLLHVGKKPLEESDVEWIAHAWNEVSGGDDVQLAWHLGKCRGQTQPCVTALGDWERLAGYVGKYIGKCVASLPGWEWPGRFWGYRNRKNIPVRLVEIPVDGPDKDVGYRFQRIARRWLRHQRNGRYKFTLGDGVVQRGKVKDLGPQAGMQIAAWKEWASSAAPAMRRLGHGEVGFRDYHCRRPAWGGGITVFWDNDTVERVLDWALSERVGPDGTQRSLGVGGVDGVGSGSG